MKAVIMAGGEGTRLRPLTCDIPKPMVSFFDKPLVQHTIEHLKNNGIENMIFTLMYKPERITGFFDDGNDFGVHIEYSIEPSPLGTAGSVKHALTALNETILVVSGDALMDIDIIRAVQFHKNSSAKATLVLKKMENPLEYGIVITDEQNSIIKFVEKPGWREVFSDAVNTGIYILEPDVMELVPEDKNYDFAKDLFPDMLQRGIKLAGYVTDEYWCDVGNIESYIKAHEDVLKGICKIKLSGSSINGIWVGRNVKISNSSLLQAPSYIGDNCVIKDGAKVSMYSCISKNTEIGEYSNIKRGIIWSGAKLSKNVKLSAAVICDNAFVGPRSNIYEGAVIGRECNLDGQNSVAPRVKIWPNKWLENGTNANESIIWGFGQKKSLFSLRGIIGEINGSINAEKITAAGCAIAASLGKDGRYALGHDGSAVSESIAMAYASGLMLSGIRLYDLSDTPLPVLRFYMKVSGIENGAYIKNLSGQKVNIDLLHSQLVYTDKAKRKKAQAAFEYFDFMRPSKEGILKANRLNGIDQIYISDIAHHIELKKGKPLIILFAGDKKTDRLYTSCVKECGMLYTCVEGQSNYTEQTKLFNADFGIKLHGNGGSASLYSGKQAFDNADSYLSLVYLYIMRYLKPESIKLLPGLPDTVKNAALQHGIKITECSAEEMYRSNTDEINRFLTDPIFFSLNLAAYLSNESNTLDDFAKELLPSHIAEREISCEWKDIGKAIRMLYEANRDALCVEGIKVYSNKGWGFILPREDEPKITIRAEGLSEEYSRELCDFYAEELKKFIKS